MTDIVDFAVVGGGIAGIYAAWRLANAPAEALAKLVPHSAKPSVYLYESTGRLGGRLLTVTIPGTPFCAELGGMRYASSQLLMSGLISELQLDSRPFQFETCLMYLRGQHFRPQASPPYRLKPGEEHRDPGELIKYAVRLALREVAFKRDDAETRGIRERLKSLENEHEELRLSILKPNQWALLKKEATLQGAGLTEIGFWNLLAYYLSSEAFLFSHDGLGYESVLANWNAAEAIPWFLRDFGVDYLTLDRGMEILPTTVDFKFSEESSGTWYTQRKRNLRHELTSIKPVEGSDGRLLGLSFLVDGVEGRSTKDVVARYVILSLPRKPLKEKLNLSGVPGYTQHTWHDLLDSVAPHPLFKLFLGYDRGWWRDPRAIGGTSGRVTTDLPIRQVYYFTNEGAGTSHAMAMASYSDAHYVDFWDPLLVSPGRQFYYRGAEPLGKNEESVLRLYGATERMVHKAHRQILQLHPDMPPDEIPKPYVAVVMNWNRPPYDYGGWHTWNVSSDLVKDRPWEVRQKLVRPFDAHVYVCGEAYSCEQGWVEGALRSAEMVLNRLGIPSAKWIDKVDFRSQGFEGLADYVECAPSQS